MIYEKNDELAFITPYDQFKEHNGKSCIVLETVKPLPGDDQAENQTIPIQFEDGTKIEALPEELHISGWFNRQIESPPPSEKVDLRDMNALRKKAENFGTW